ncbi:N-acetylmuramic acid 6-phosphate etherase [Streptomonospora wellingtoniae]|uniref:N-acetylmuramic acid 6-phosphate etherase n=1 Tax=Streptomonospora wellingtoniae TaxID=3075544 RepID=A0ABU2KT27_9ACTN|nr:N-acetylmuramic acid 6-phosphate etherase [Streptomonospora sp. DSM 45055]MDT0302440.1 N-acetylmuramic acid 6-phosphate etherase [Streptomonospora sp. DSM 45055]
MTPQQDAGRDGGTAAVPAPLEIVRVPTERRNQATYDIDRLTTLGILREINAEDATVPRAVAAVLPDLARAVDLGVEALRSGGRIHYFGAGTPGRIATTDAAELPPTFGTAPETVLAHHAGGAPTLERAAEGIEDDEDLGRDDAGAVGADDLAVGLTASGRTPYVAGALRAARRAGAATVLVTANPEAPLARDADVHVGVDTGAEVIAGSTRMKAGTAQKLVLNAFSTAVMVRLGRTYSNLMVGVNATNAKLRGRAVTILTEASGMDEDSCAAALTRADGDARVALVTLLTGVGADRAAAELTACGGRVREALQQIGDAPEPR